MTIYTTSIDAINGLIDKLQRENMDFQKDLKPDQARRMKMHAELLAQHLNIYLYEIKE